MWSSIEVYIFKSLNHPMNKNVTKIKKNKNSKILLSQFPIARANYAAKSSMIRIYMFQASQSSD